jgi:hypothetical protein
MKQFLSTPVHAETAGDLWRLKEQLEENASRHLGKFLFGFSRLEFVLALAIASVTRRMGGHGSPVVKKPGNFYANLDAFAGYIAGSADLDKEAKLAYAVWVTDVNSLRARRNSLVHGRWVAEAQRGVILNVLEPIPGEPVVTEYTIKELEALSLRPENLHMNYSNIFCRWPI